MNLAEIIQAVADAGFDTTAGASSSGQIQSWVNERYRRLVADTGWLREQVQLGTTATGVVQYPVAGDMTDVANVVVGGAPYQRISPRELVEVKAGIRVLLGEPAFAPAYSASGAPYVELYPEPAAGQAVLALVERIPATLTGTATPVLPIDFHDALVDGAIATGMRRVYKRYDDADRHELIFQDHVKRLQRRVNSRIGSGATQVRLG